MIQENKKLIALDLDETISLSRQKASNDMIQALNQLLKYYKVLIISGADKERINDQILQYLDYPNQFYVGEYCGGKIWYGKEIIRDNKFSSYDRKTIYSAIDYLLKNRESIEMNSYQATYYLVPTNSKNRDNIDPNNKKRLKIINELQKVLPFYNIGLGGKTSINISINSKQESLKFLSTFCSIDPNRILFIGDKCFKYGNDFMGDFCPNLNVNCIEETLLILQSLIKQKETHYVK